MRRSAPTPLRIVCRGALAGYAGLAAMGAVFKPVQALTGDDSGPPADWSEAAPPAQFAQRFIEGVALRQVSIDRAPLLNNGMHALYAPALGLWFGVFQESLRPRLLSHALAFSATVWGLRVTLNPALKLTEPFWRSPPGKIAIDASFHLAFGLAVAYSYRELERRGV